MLKLNAEMFRRPWSFPAFSRCSLCQRNMTVINGSTWRCSLRDGPELLGSARALRMNVAAGGTSKGNRSHVLFVGFHQTDSG